jgi:hypothetical protein
MTGNTIAVSLVNKANAKKQTCPIRHLADASWPARMRHRHAASANIVNKESFRPGIQATTDTSAGCAAKRALPILAPPFEI